MKAIYTDFYGCTATLQQAAGRETTKLTVRTSGGHLIHRQEYHTWRGAKIAMGKLGDCWREKSPPPV